MALDPAGGSVDKQCLADTQGTLYTAPITNVERLTATSVRFTISGSNKFIVNNRILSYGTADDGGSFNTPQVSGAYLVDELVTAVSGQTVTVTQSTARGTNPFSISADTGTLQKAQPYFWEDTSVSPRQWWGCTQFGNVIQFGFILQNDYSLLSSGAATYSGINSWSNAKNVKFASAFGPYTDSSLNYCHDTRLRTQALGGNGWGEYAVASCRPTTVNAAYGGNNLAPASERMPFLMQVQMINAQGDSSNLAASSCGLALCPIKTDFANVRSSVFPQFNRGEIDVFDTVFTDTTNSWLAKFLQTAAMQATYQNDNHDYLVGYIMDESDTSFGTGEGGEMAVLIGNGALTAPAGGVAGGGLVVNTVASHNKIFYHLGPKILSAQYRITSQRCTNMRPSGSSCSSSTGNNKNQVFPDDIYHTKVALANWLQGTQEQLTSIACTRSAGVVTCTLGAANVGQDGAHYYNAPEVVTLSSCTDSTFNTVAGTGMVLSSINAGAGTVTGTLAGAGASATCTVGAGPGYSSIGSLITAWGVTGGVWDTFGTDETRVTGEALFTGSGIAGPYTGNLSGSPSTYTPGSLKIYVGGVLTCADLGDGYKLSSPATTNHLTCNTNNSSSNINGTIDTAAGAYSITFDATTSAAVTADYSKSGWGTGKGLLDEAGAGISCSTDLFGLSSGTCGAAFKTDMDNFQYYSTKQAFATLRKIYHKFVPGVMLNAANPWGAFGVTANPSALQALCQYSDWATPPSLPVVDPTSATSDGTTRLNLFSQYCLARNPSGQDGMPWIALPSGTHVSDSYEGGNAALGNKLDSTFTGAGSSAPDFLTGTALGNYFRDTWFPALNAVSVNCNGTCTANNPFAGWDWQEGDHIRLGAFWTPFWDFIDGSGEAQPNPSINARGYPSGCIGTMVGTGDIGRVAGCNPNTSGNVVTAFSQGATSWLNNITRTHSTGTMGGSNH